MPLAPIQPATLTGRFVRLEPIEERHRDGLRAAADDPRIWPYMPMNGAPGADFDRMVTEAIAAKQSGTTLPFVVRRLSDDAVVGSSRYLNIAVEDGNLEIGWTWYAPTAWAGAVNPESKRLMLEHAFGTLGAVRVGLRCDGRNKRSHDAILRLGAVKEGVLRRHKLVHDGFIRDTVQFSILAEEWPAVRDRLDRRLALFGEAAAV